MFDKVVNRYIYIKISLARICFEKAHWCDRSLISSLSNFVSSNKMWGCDWSNAIFEIIIYFKEMYKMWVLGINGSMNKSQINSIPIIWLFFLVEAQVSLSIENNRLQKFADPERAGIVPKHAWRNRTIRSEPGRSLFWVHIMPGEW